MIYKYKVSELINNIKITLGEIFPVMELIGEVSEVNLNNKSGHLYFTLKDEKATISCACWKNSVPSLLPFIKEGAKVSVTGRVSLFPSGSKIYFNALEAKPDGIGNIQKHLMELKQKLENLGYFDAKNKKPIPRFPKHIALITSMDGAVIEDIKTTLKSRFPTKVSLVDVPVQGKESVDKIINALFILQKIDNLPDVIIIARGGGSIEDLFHFNDESLVASISKCKIPIITAIGHQPNSTFADLASSLSVATPTASVHFLAEKQQLHQNLQDKLKSIKSSIAYNLNYLTQKVTAKEYRIQNISHIITNNHHSLNYIFTRMQNLTMNKINIMSKNLLIANNSFKNANLFLHPYHYKITQLQLKLHKDIKIIAESSIKLVIKSNKINEYLFNIQNYQQKLDNLNRIINNLSFQQTLKRGYSILLDKNHKIISSLDDLKDGEYNIKFHDGIKSIKITIADKG